MDLMEKTAHHRGILNLTLDTHPVCNWDGFQVFSLGKGVNVFCVYKEGYMIDTWWPKNRTVVGTD